MLVNLILQRDTKTDPFHSVLKQHRMLLLTLSYGKKGLLKYNFSCHAVGREQ
jgi:hypothetical protein